MAVRVPGVLFVALLVASAWAGCLGDGNPRADATVQDAGGALPGNLTADKVVTAPVRLVDLPLGKGDLEREYRDREVLPDPLGLFESRTTVFTVNVTELWPTTDLKYQVWLLDEEANASLRSPVFAVSDQGSRAEFQFEFRGAHPKTYNKAFVTLEPDNDDRMGLAVLSGTFESGDAPSLAFSIAGLMSDVASQGTLQAGKGQFTLAFAATGIPAVADAEYHVWLELGGNSTDLGAMEADDDATDSWGFAAAELIKVPGALFLDSAKFAITLEPKGNKDDKPSGAVLLRALTTP